MSSSQPSDAPAPAYLVRGDDPSLVAQSARDLLSRLVGDEDPSVVVEDHGGDDIEIGAIATACATPPLFSRRRVVVLRDVGALAADQVSTLAGCLDSLVSSTTLVLLAGGGPLPASLTNAVKKKGEVLDASPGTGRARTAWTESRFQAAPVRLDARAARRVTEHLGDDLGRLSGLLDTLAGAFGEGARLGLEDIEPFLGEAGSQPPWELTDAIDRGDTAVALAVARRMTGPGGRHPLGVLAVLHRHYSSMLALDGATPSSDAEAAELLGTSSAFRAGKTLAAARRLGSAGIARAIELLAGADLDLRGLSGWSPEVVLEILVARLSRLGRQRGKRRPARSR